jgi:hypothetical protein
VGASMTNAHMDRYYKPNRYSAAQD